MNPHSQKILKTARKVSYAVAVVTAAALFLFRDHPRLAAWTGGGGQILVLLLVLIFGYVLLALAIQFASDLLRPRRIAASGTLLALRGPRAASLLMALGAAALVAVGASLVLLPQSRLDDWGVQSPFPGMAFHEQALFGLLGAVGAFLALAFLLRALVNPPWFLLTREGFLYAPGGVSPGLVQWIDVEDIRESHVLAANPRGRGEPVMRPTLVVSLKDPDKYVKTYTPLLQWLVRAANAVLRAQTKGGDIYLDPADFGQRYEEISARMRELAELPAPAARP
jgi:hypothetical protein